MNPFTIKLYLLTTVVFLAIDFIWLAVIASKFYQRYLGYLLTPTPNFIAAFVFYLIFTLGLCVFVIMPHLNSSSLIPIVTHAILFGIVTYATYDLTNLATIKDWPAIVVFVDLIWGASVSSLTSVIVFKLIPLLK